MGLYPYHPIVLRVLPIAIPLNSNPRKDAEKLEIPFDYEASIELPSWKYLFGIFLEGCYIYCNPIPQH